MLIDELIQLITQIKATKSESNQLELKAAKNGAPKLYDTLSSFSNQTGGGIIVFGVDEEDDYNICGVYDAADLQKKISEQSLQMEPTVRPLCTVATIEGKNVVSAEIQEIEMSLRPCYYTGKGKTHGSYIRVGDADRKMTEYEIYSYEAFRKKLQDELRVTERATFEDIKTRYLDEYLLKLSAAKPNLANLPVQKQLQLQGLLIDEKPTLAGALLFAEYPQSFYPRLCITAVVVPGTEMGELSSDGARFIDNKTIDGTLPEMLTGALTFVRKNMATSTIIDPDTGLRKDKTEYPLTAIREIILNALIHRDYSIHTDSAPITIVMYKNRIEIENPGGLYGRLTLDTLGMLSADTRNPFIAGAMEVRSDTENRFSGIPTIRREMKLVGLPAPIFQNERGSFKVILFNSNAKSSGDDLESEILKFCIEPKSREELSERFNHITKIYLMTNFVNPLVENGRLKLTIPEKPKSKNQKFVTLF